MKIFIKFYVLIFLVSILNGCGERTIKMDYPETKKLDLVETIFGETIEDPYRWLEDFTSIESREWVEKHVEGTASSLVRIPIPFLLQSI